MTGTGEIELSGTGRDLALANEHLYLVEGSTVRIFDVADPDSPAEVGMFAASGWVVGAEVSGSLLFVAVQSSGLVVVDVGDPTNPQTLGAVATPGQPIGLAVANDHAFLTGGSAGVWIVDVSDPFDPVLLATADAPGWASCVIATARVSRMWLQWDSSPTLGPMGAFVSWTWPIRTPLQSLDRSRWRVPRISMWSATTPTWSTGTLPQGSKPSTFRIPPIR
ncbi:MAG: hypothetical protein H6682_16660 [Candidatus Eisenbacteria bacterium]|nr:hypothetical protein [Candidatus Eisenbacteria bacterium]